MFVRFSKEQEKHLRCWIEERGLSTFTNQVRAELAKLLRNLEAVELIEAACAIGDFTNREDHMDMHRAVLKLLRKRGVSLGRGKKASPVMVAFVETVVPIAIAFGVPLRSGENSRMNRVLSVVLHAGLGMEGDPRDELRRQIRWKRTADANAKRAILEAVARGLRGLAPPVEGGAADPSATT